VSAGLKQPGKFPNANEALCISGIRHDISLATGVHGYTQLLEKWGTPGLRCIKTGSQEFFCRSSYTDEQNCWAVAGDHVRQDQIESLEKLPKKRCEKKVPDGGVAHYPAW